VNQRKAQLLDALGPADAPAPAQELFAQGTAAANTISVQQQATVNAVIQSYLDGEQASAPADSLTAAVHKAERDAAASAAPSVAGAPSQHRVAEAAPANTQSVATATLPAVAAAPASAPFLAPAPSTAGRDLTSGSIESYNQGSLAQVPTDSLSADQRSAARGAFASAPAAALVATAPTATYSLRPNRDLASGSIESYDQPSKAAPAPGPAPLLSEAQQQAARDAFATAPAAPASAPVPSRDLTSGSIESYDQPSLSAARQQVARDAFTDAPAAAPTMLSTAQSSMGPSSMESYEQGQRAAAPTQRASTEQQKASQATFAPVASAEAIAPSAKPLAAPAQAPQPAIELTSAQQEAIRRVFLNSSAPAPASAGKEDYSPVSPAHAPDPAVELTPAQREAIRRIFLNITTAPPPASAGKEDYAPGASAQASLLLCMMVAMQIQCTVCTACLCDPGKPLQALASV